MENRKVFIPDDSLVWLLAEVTGDYGNGCEEYVNVVITDSIFQENTNEIEEVSITKLHRKVYLNHPNLKNKLLPLQNIYKSDDCSEENMCSLNYLHEAGILENLRRRFQNKLPYTYANEICVAVNPYQWLDIYTTSIRHQYATQSRESLTPHVYAISSSAFINMKQTLFNQSIIVSGESGAGRDTFIDIVHHVINILFMVNKYSTFILIYNDYIIIIINR